MPVKESRTYVAIVLDRSGSMEKCKDATLSGLNEYIQQQKADCVKNGSLPTYVSLVAFNSQPEELYWNQSINYFNELTEHDYIPLGWTAMWDAVGYTIEKLKATTDYANEDNDYFILIVSDGEENKSANFTCYDEKQEEIWANARKVPVRRQLPPLIDECQGTKRWTFVYLGANQDLSVVQKQMHMSASNIARYSATSKGFDAAWGTTIQQMSSHMSDKMEYLKAAPPMCGKGFASSNFFNKSNKIEDLTTKSKEEVKPAQKPWNEFIVEAARKNQEKWESKI
jgi:hypothetical protein